jgi:hypothetical protein
MLTIWMVVTDRARARILLHRPGRQPLRLFTLEHPQAHGSNRDFDSDRPGNVFKPAEAAFHAMGQENDARQQETLAFARQIAQPANLAFARHEFDRLVMAAEPGLLGVLRACLSAQLAAATIDVPRNLAMLADRAIESEMPLAFRNRGASAHKP